MPTERFLNLPEEKRQRVLDAARQEFVRVPYDEVSINRIVRTAGIPRGSFYQYFADKQDLLGHIVHGYAGELHALFEQELAASGGDVFAVMEQALEYAMRLGQAQSERDFFFNVLSSIRLRDVERFVFLQPSAEEMQAAYGEKLDRSRMRRQDDEFVQSVVGMLGMLLAKTLACLFAGKAAPEQIKAEFLQRLDIIKHGALAEGGTA